MSLRLTEDQYKNLQAKAKGSAAPGVMAATVANPDVQVMATEKKDPMNKTERRYLIERIEPAMRDGSVLVQMFESLKFRLAPSTFYTPDFLVVTASGVLELHEVKGGWIEEDAMVKFKSAAEKFSFFRWKMWQYKDGAWSLLRDL